MYCIIECEYFGNHQAVFIYPTAGQEHRFANKVLDRIEEFIELGIPIIKIERHGF